MHIIGVILTRIFLHRIADTETGQTIAPRWATLIPVAMIVLSFAYVKVVSG